MSVDPRRSSPLISNRTKTLFMAGAVIALAAVPAWRTKLLDAKFRAPAIAMEQGTGQWTPFAVAPLLYPQINLTPNLPHSGRVSSVAVDPPRFTAVAARRRQWRYVGNARFRRNLDAHHRRRTDAGDWRRSFRTKQP
jgi:hypothetical protein